MLPKTISAPVARSCSISSPLTLAWVATGMNAGSCTSPCGVEKTERRAAQCGVGVQYLEIKSHHDNLALANRLRLTPASAASTANRR